MTLEQAAVEYARAWCAYEREKANDKRDKKSVDDYWEARKQLEKTRKGLETAALVYYFAVTPHAPR